jgi:hypothetical protein
MDLSFASDAQRRARSETTSRAGDGLADFRTAFPQPIHKIKPMAVPIVMYCFITITSVINGFERMENLNEYTIGKAFFK